MQGKGSWRRLGALRRLCGVYGFQVLGNQHWGTHWFSLALGGRQSADPLNLSDELRNWGGEEFRAVWWMGQIHASFFFVGTRKLPTLGNRVVQEAMDRLMKTPWGQIVANEKARLHSPPTVLWQDQPQGSLLLSLAGRRRHRPTLLERETEQNMLKKWGEEIKEGKSALAISLFGPEGSGRNALLGWALQHWHQESWIICRRDGRPHTRFSPWHVLSPIVREILGYLGCQDPLKMVQWWKSFDPGGHYEVRALDQIINPREKLPLGWVEPESIFVAVRQLVRRLTARAPLVIALGGWACIDEDTRWLFTHLAKEGDVGPFLLLSTSEEKAPLFSKILPLSFLSSESQSLYIARQGLSLLPEGRRRTPLAWRESLAKGSWVSNRREVCASLLSDIPRGVRKELEILAVLGNIVSGKILTALDVELGEDAKEFLIAVGNGWRFRDNHQRKAIYGAIPRARRKSLHGKIAACLARNLHQSQAQRAGMIFHLQEAGEDKKAKENKHAFSQLCLHLGALRTAFALNPQSNLRAWVNIPRRSKSGWSRWIPPNDSGVWPGWKKIASEDGLINRGSLSSPVLSPLTWARDRWRTGLLRKTKGSHGRFLHVIEKSRKEGWLCTAMISHWLCGLYLEGSGSDRHMEMALNMAKRGGWKKDLRALYSDRFHRAQSSGQLHWVGAHWETLEGVLDTKIMVNASYRLGRWGWGLRNHPKEWEKLLLHPEEDESYRSFWKWWLGGGKGRSPKKGLPDIALLWNSIPTAGRERAVATLKLKNFLKVHPHVEFEWIFKARLAFWGQAKKRGYLVTLNVNKAKAILRDLEEKLPSEMVEKWRKRADRLRFFHAFGPL